MFTRKLTSDVIGDPNIDLEEKVRRLGQFRLDHIELIEGLIHDIVSALHTYKVGLQEVMDEYENPTQCND